MRLSCHYWCYLCVLLAASGCTRTRYRVSADRETYGVLSEKTVCEPWQLPPGFSVQPDPRARFCDPTPVDDPWLPIPSPRLYGYRLPELPRRDPTRFRTSEAALDPLAPTTADLRRLPPADGGVHVDPLVQQVAYHQEMVPSDGASAAEGTELHAFAIPAPGVTAAEETPALVADELEARSTGRDHVTPIPQEDWDSLPASCLIRMFEFRSIRGEACWLDLPTQRLFNTLACA